MREIKLETKGFKARIYELNKKEVACMIEQARKKKGLFFEGEVFTKKTERELKKKLSMVLMDSSGTLLIP